MYFRLSNEEIENGRGKPVGYIAMLGMDKT